MDKTQIDFQNGKIEQALVQAYFLDPHLALSVFPSCNSGLSVSFLNGHLVGWIYDEVNTLKKGLYCVD